MGFETSQHCITDLATAAGFTQYTDTGLLELGLQPEVLTETRSPSGEEGNAYSSAEIYQGHRFLEDEIYPLLRDQRECLGSSFKNVQNYVDALSRGVYWGLSADETGDVVLDENGDGFIEGAEVGKNFFIFYNKLQTDPHFAEVYQESVESYALELAGQSRTEGMRHGGKGKAESLALQAWLLAPDLPAVATALSLQNVEVAALTEQKAIMDGVVLQIQELFFIDETNLSQNRAYVVLTLDYLSGLIKANPADKELWSLAFSLWQGWNGTIAQLAQDVALEKRPLAIYPLNRTKSAIMDRYPLGYDSGAKWQDGQMFISSDYFENLQPPDQKAGLTPSNEVANVYYLEALRQESKNQAVAILERVYVTHHDKSPEEMAKLFGLDAGNIFSYTDFYWTGRDKESSILFHRQLQEFQVNLDSFLFYTLKLNEAKVDADTYFSLICPNFIQAESLSVKDVLIDGNKLAVCFLEGKNLLSELETSPAMQELFEGLRAGQSLSDEDFPMLKVFKLYFHSLNFTEGYLRGRDLKKMWGETLQYHPAKDETPAHFESIEDFQKNIRGNVLKANNLLFTSMRDWQREYNAKLAAGTDAP